MKKKFVSMLIALSLLTQSSMVWAEEKSEVTSNSESQMTKESDQPESEDKASEEKLEEEIYPTIEAPAGINSPTASVVTGDQFKLKVGSKHYKKNGSAYVLSAAPLYYEGRTYLPLRATVVHILGGSLSFDQNSGVMIVTTEGIQLQMTVGNKAAYLNEQGVTMSAAPINKNGTTYIPVNILSSYFGYKADFVSKSKEISIIGQDKGVNNPPIADFELTQSSYTEGQMVKAVSTCQDPDGHKLTDKLWCLIDSQDNIKTDKDLTTLFKSPKAGNYRIGLMVKDQYGYWSEWKYKDLKIYPNKAPVITYMGAPKSKYGQGEVMEFQYCYENEDWENVTNEKWTYRRANEEPSKAMIGKPNALFTGGDYIVTLELDDEYGNRSEVYETNVHITEEVFCNELSFCFTQGRIGDLIDNYTEFNYREYEDANITSKSVIPGRMIMSDSPEKVAREGILYRDNINGEGRILLHHFNQFSTSHTKRLVVVAENKTNKTQTVSIKNKAIKGPVNDILFLGQKLLYDYLAGGDGNKKLTLKPGEKKFIYDSGTKWKQDTCISGLMDVNTTGDVTFTIAAISPQHTINSVKYLQPFDAEIHPRGTFEGIGMNYTLDLDSSKPTKLVIGNGQEEWVKGYDAFSHTVAYNKGNYGITYYITIKAKETMGIILNPRADVYRGAIKWQGEGVYNVPTSGAIFMSTTKAMSLGTIRAGETKTFEYMLPNGSSAPIVIGFIPENYWYD